MLATIAMVWAAISFTVMSTTAAVITRAAEGQGERARIERPAALGPMIVEKAFIAINGVSLTVAAVGEEWFEITLIPETLERTSLGSRPSVRA